MVISQEIKQFISVQGSQGQPPRGMWVCCKQCPQKMPFNLLFSAQNEVGNLKPQNFMLCDYFLDHIKSVHRLHLQR